MFTECLDPVSENFRTDQSLERAARLIQQGAIVALPSETIYGLGASILCELAIERLFLVKKRESHHSLPVLISNLNQLKFLAKNIPESFYLLAKYFLPGPLTIILKKNSLLSSRVTGNKETVAIRFSSNPITNRIVELVGCPIAFPSANFTGTPSPISAKHVLEDFNGKIPAIVNGGETEFGLESTLISLENPKQPSLLRFGVIQQREIEKVLGQQLQVHPQAFLNQKQTAQEKYFPAIRLFSSWEEMKIYLQLSNESKRLVMSSEEKSQIVKENNFFQLTAKNLYEGLRLALRRGCAEVLVHCNSQIKNNETLHQRLKQIAST